MIPLTVGLNELASKISTHPFKVKMQPFVHLFSKDLLSVFGYKDQMQVK
jgi:hypothetical protein